MKLKNLKETKVYSQYGEDGIIEEIFKRIGTTNKTFVEFGIQNGTECNCRRLVEDFKWNGLFIDGNKRDYEKAKEHYRDFNIKIVNKFITAENINSIFRRNEITGEIDLLSIDIDGNDYWIWKAIKEIKPRVVIIEYTSSFGKKSWTIPYKSDWVWKTPKLFQRWKWIYKGASLKAMIKLGKQKGYKIVYTNGLNAFFIKKDIKELEELSFKEAYKEHKDIETGIKNNFTGELWGNQKKQFELIKNKRFISV
jgi:hypothetical protein